MSTCHNESNIAAWVLGALPDEEAGPFASHLASCQTCPPQIASLQGVVDCLPLAALPAAPPDALRDRIMRTVRAEAELLAAAGPEADRPPVTAAAPRRRRFSLTLRPQLAGVLACGLLALGVAGGLVVSRDGGTQSIDAVASFRSAPDAAAKLLVENGGKNARLTVAGLPAPPSGRVYQVWVVRKGSPTPRPTDALFQPDGTGHATVQVPGGVRDVDAVLVTSEPNGGAPDGRPSSIPAIKADLTTS